jgi:Protein of unknown function (DUF2442)
MTGDRISDAAYERAIQAGREAAATEIRARSVRYLPDRDTIEIVTASQAGFLIPRAWVASLQHVPVADLARLTVWPDGSAIELEDHDIHISVHGLMTAILPALLPARTVAAMFASVGGRATSQAKRTTAQANGRKGGRPAKQPTTAAT